MVAILEDALAILSRGRRSGRMGPLFWETRRWVASDEVDWPFSFVNVCQVLGIGPTALRRRVAGFAGTERARGDAAVSIRVEALRIPRTVRVITREARRTGAA